MASDTQDNIESSIRDTNSEAQNAADSTARARAAAPQQIYKLDPKTKVPVSYYEGQNWKSRKNAGRKLLSPLMEAWREAEAYYGNSQMDHRRETEGQYKGNDVVAKNRNRKYSSTVNIVYATVNASIPSIYAKNPNVEITMTDKQLEPLGVALEHFCNNLIARKDAPGINLKPKIRKAVMRCEVTNEAWVLIGWTPKEISADGALEEIQRIGKELQDATDAKKIEELEGQLMALEESCDLLDPTGPFVKSVRGDQVIMDISSEEDDHEDAKWTMVEMMLPTVYLNARFRQKDPQDPSGQTYVSAYKASHIVDASQQKNGVTAEQQEIDNFHIFDAGKDNPQSYGYEDTRSYERAKMTKVWYCFDKVKRRFYLYADNDWTWPVWVFDDPYHLPSFTPLCKLQYHTDPRRNRTRGEVSHYLDQQDTLNTMEDEMNRARTIVRDKVLFDPEKIDASTVDNIFLDPTRKAVPVKGLSDGLEKAISAPPLPNQTHKHLWDPTHIIAQINQISGTGDAQRGEQFKTNTTNQAIEFYNSVSGVRQDEKRDAIEDFIGDIAYKVLFLCLQFMPAETFIEIAGSEFAPIFSDPSVFRNMTPAEIRKTIRCRIEGGSTQKPTSAAKKAEALQVGQILGQFGRAAPMAFIVALKVFERAFDSVVVTSQDWNMIIQTLMMSLQQGNNAPGEGQPGQEGEGQNEDEEVNQVVERAKQRGTPVDPEQARAALKKRKSQQTH